MIGPQHRQEAFYTAFFIMTAVKVSSPAYETVFNAVSQLEDALRTKKHNSAAFITGISLDVDRGRITVKRLTLAGHKGPYDFTANVSIMGALSDPENADALITGLPEHVFMSVTLNGFLLIRGTPHRLAELILKNAWRGGKKHDNTRKSTGTGSAGSNDHARDGQPGNSGIN